MPQPPRGRTESIWRRACLSVADVLLLTSMLTAAFGIPEFICAAPTTSQRLSVFVGLVLGPVSGWTISLQRHDTNSALPMVGTVTVVCLTTFVVAIAKRSSTTLGLAAVFWFLAGYLFTIAIWA